MARRWLMLGFITLLVLLSITAGANAMGKLVTTQEKLVVVPYYDTTYYGYVFAELTNSGDKPVAYANGLMELFDPDGNALASNSLYDCYPSVLAPGESGYLYGSSYVEAPNPEHIADFMLSVTGQGTISKTVTRLDATARFETVEDTYSTYEYLVAEMTNTLDVPLTDFEIVYAVKDEAGGLIYVASSYWSGYNVGLMPGSSLEMRYQMESSISTYMHDNKIVPATVEVIVYNTK